MKELQTPPLPLPLRGGERLRFATHRRFHRHSKGVFSGTAQEISSAQHRSFQPHSTEDFNHTAKEISTEKTGKFYDYPQSYHQKTAARSTLINRGYERSEHPRIADEQTASTLKGSPIKQHGHSSRVLRWMIPDSGGTSHPRLVSDDAFSVLVVRSLIIMKNPDKFLSGFLHILEKGKRFFGGKKH